MSSLDNTKIKYLIADTTAFINAAPLNNIAENVLTVPDVIAEVKNKRQIRRLCVLPFDLQVREPRADSVKHCVEFAKKTGDYASLSGIDLKVIALTYELEADNLGTSHLRTEPKIAKIISSKEKPEEFQDSTKLAGWYNPSGDGDEDDDQSEEEENSSDNEESEQIESSANNKEEVSQKDSENNNETQEEDNSEDDDEITTEQLDKLLQNLSCESGPNNDANLELLMPESANGEIDENDDKDEADRNEEDPSSQKEDDGDDWITPKNIAKVKKSLEGKLEADTIPVVACVTTDYALQNVLKQMNLQISALDGRIIKQLRTYILRCYTCFKTTSIMTKVFCPKCGNKTLKRVSVSLADDGSQVIHVNTKRPLSTKYKNQSLPRFQGGKHSRNPILFEDQPIPKQMPSRVAKTKTNALEEDYIAGFSPFVMRDIDSKSALLRSKGNLKEWARNNTFEEDRRRKHYNRLYK